jgi:HSP20 family protein
MGLEKEVEMNLPMLPLQREIEALRERFDRLLGDTGIAELGSEQFAMPIDLKETDDAFEVTVSLPGAKPENVSVDLTNDRLTISTSTEESTEKEEKGYHIRERRSGSMRRMITLPGSVREADVDAVLENGVLKLTLPKAGEAKRSIPVRGT